MAVVNSASDQAHTSTAMRGSGWKIVLVLSVVAIGLAVGALAGALTICLRSTIESRLAERLKPPTRPAESESGSSLEDRGDEKLAEQDYAGALELYHRLADPEHAAPLVRFRVGLCLEGLGKLDEAQQVFAELMHRHPDTILEFASRVGLARLEVQRGRLESALRQLARAILQAKEGVTSIPAVLGQARLSFVGLLVQSRFSATNPEPLQPTVVVPAWTIEHPEDSWFWLRRLGEAALRPWPVSRDLVQLQPEAHLEQSPVSLQLRQGNLLDLLRRLAAQAPIELSVSEKASAVLAGQSVRSLWVGNLPLGEILTLLLEPEGCVWYLQGSRLNVLTLEEIHGGHDGHAEVRSLSGTLSKPAPVTDGGRHLQATVVAAARWRAAIATLNRLILENTNQQLPQVQRVYWLMGLCHLALGQTQESVMWWERFIQRWPQTPEAFYISFNLGVLNWERGDLAAAKRWWMRAADQSPGHALTPLAYLYIGRAELEQLQVESAIMPLRRAGYASPKSPVRQVAQLRLAACWLYLENAAAAHDLLVRERRWLQAEPFRSSAAFLDAFARAYLASRPVGLPRAQKQEGSLPARSAEDLLAALLQVQDWRILEPLGPLLAGQAWMKLHLPEQALPIYQADLLRARSVWRQELLQAYAESCLLCGRYDEVRRASGELLQSSDPARIASAHWLLARCAFHQGHFAESVDHARQVLFHPAKVPREDLLRLMGETYTALGDSQRAAECFAGRIPQP